MHRFALPSTTALLGCLSLSLITAPLHANPGKFGHLTPQAAEAADPEFLVQGEYVGEIEGKKIGVQLIAMPKGTFQKVTYQGGLPGAGWDKASPTRETLKQLEDSHLTGLKRIERKSPTLGQEPPKEATVLFDGTSMDNWNGGSLTEEKHLLVQAKSKLLLKDHSLHLEFRIPYKREATGQGRGNSGVYLQGRYEVQVLDTFGLKGADNECGGIYKISSPKENMCFPPLTWQTYDIEFTAAKWNDDGSKASNARITVRHNGVLIQEDVELPRTTTAAPVKETAEGGPLYLQGHGNKVHYRNIWVVEQ